MVEIKVGKWHENLEENGNYPSSQMNESLTNVQEKEWILN